MKQTFRGACVGVDLVPRGSADRHILVKILIEDDENWIEKLSISSYWLDEMIDQLITARDYCHKQERDTVNGGWNGWRFK